MPDLSIEFCGVKAPNPFWLASGPPTNSEYQVRRAFDAGWGGAVWKTIAHEPIVNVTSRYGAIDFEGRKVMGLNNIELITDRTLETNLTEIARVKKAHPECALFVSLMVESTREAWHEITKKTQDTGADGIELNFGCPHGMSERGMGSAVGQVPDYTCMITEWVKEVARIPVMVKLTPNISDPTAIGRAAAKGGADAVSLINTINSIMGIDLDTFAPKPAVRGLGSHGGYCGPAVKPIALHMVAAIAGDRNISLPISGIGGIQAWQDAAEFLLLGASSLQVCTAVMHYGFRIIDQLTSGLENWMRQQGFASPRDFVGRSVPRIKTWGELDLSYKLVARIEQEKCIHCGLCYVACEDGCHQSIRLDRVNATAFLKSDGHAAHAFRSGGMDILPGAGGETVNVFTIKEDTCVGCNMCSLVCPVDGCISMVEVDSGMPPINWNEYQARLAAGKMEKIAPPEHV
ncbi:MAG TPA: NAD-dependent dihydropyrimidine dehydrogenase subunit PreA [Isosphaeraceae bacterium]|nr:NAD-dependent dihydropyrimidine dehydrogenase subunit PreA [Isosphaeraceae bacterium]